MGDLKTMWIVAYSGSDMDNVVAYEVYGTKRQVKNHLLKLVKDDKHTYETECNEEWEYGTESISEIEERPDGSYYAYGCYCSCHNDYTARPLGKTTELKG